MQFSYMVEKLDTGGYMAYCPVMKPVIVYADKKEDLSKKIHIVAKVYLKRHPDIAKKLNFTSGND